MTLLSLQPTPLKVTFPIVGTFSARHMRISKLLLPVKPSFCISSIDAGRSTISNFAFLKHNPPIVLRLFPLKMAVVIDVFSKELPFNVFNEAGNSTDSNDVKPLKTELPISITPSVKITLLSVVACARLRATVFIKLPSMINFSFPNLGGHNTNVFVSFSYSIPSTEPHVGFPSST